MSEVTKPVLLDETGKEIRDAILLVKEAVQNQTGGSGGGGVSPTIGVEDIDGGHRLTITDVNGEQTVDVMDGVDGEDYVLTDEDKEDIAAMVSPAGDSRQEYMLRIADEANKHIKANTLTFLWITDTHTTLNDGGFIGSRPDIGSLCARMTKYVPCEFIAHTGDIVDGQTPVADELSLLTALNRNFMDAACPTFYVKGNHDDNRLYARSQSGVALNDENNFGLGVDYIRTEELYTRTNAFNKSSKKPVGNKDMYFYVDDENTKIRSIFVNIYDYDETVDENGERVGDSVTSFTRDEQSFWVRDVALNFADKANPSEWGVILFSHQRMVWGKIADGTNGIQEHLAKFQQAGGEVIAAFQGDDHFDGLERYTQTWSDGITYARLTGLNASRSTGMYPTNIAESEIVLKDYGKTVNTDDDTAFDIVTIDRESKRIYLTRYGVLSYAYSDESESHSLKAARTRIIDYENCEYVQMIDGSGRAEPTNILKGIAFEKGGIDSTGADTSSTFLMRSGMVDISSLRGSASGARNFYFVAYDVDNHDTLLTAFRVHFYGYNDGGDLYRVGGADGGDSNNDTYGFPDGARAAYLTYNAYTKTELMRCVIQPGSAKTIRIVVYEVVDGVRKWIDWCDIDNIL